MAAEEVDAPNDGDVVLMRQAKHPVHAGLWLDIDGGGVLHCVLGISDISCIFDYLVKNILIDFKRDFVIMAML